MLFHASQLPQYSDPNWQDRFIGIYSSTMNSDELSREWYEAKAQVQTPRDGYVDVGIGVSALGLSLAVLLACHHVRRLREIGRLASPSSPTSFLWISALSWLSFVPAYWAELYFTQWRGDYPYWADSIGIPAFGALAFGALGLPVVLAGAAVVTRFGAFPALLCARPLLGRPLILSAGLTVPAILAATVLWSALVSEPFLVPSALLVIYLLLSGRAVISHHERAA